MPHDSQATATRANVWNAERVLEELGAALGDHAADLEFSLRLRPQAIEPFGRFGCWLAKDFASVGQALRRLGAPESVLSAQAASECPVRQGIAVAIGPDEFRLYLHGRDRATSRDTYQAWRWDGAGAVRRSRYEFHFLPETPEGVVPLDLIDAALRPAVAKTLADARMQQMSGFWLRHGADGTLEQIDLILPWHPPAGTIPGIEEIADVLTLPPEPSDWRSLPIRHIAFPLDRSGVTLYASAPPSGPWPKNEAALQRLVRRGAAELNRDIEQRIFARLPPLSGNPDGEILDQFYGGAIATWRRILGPELHYHAGLFETPDTDTVDDATMTAALRRAVTELYRFMPAGSSVYDIGCGWGGPLAMLTRDQNCRGLGLTISRTQFRHVAGLGLPVRLGDAERTLPPGAFDCALLLESFCHVAHKPRLLKVLRRFVSRLVMRVNCQDGSSAPRAFGGTMQMVSSGQLRDMLVASGWRIRHWQDRRREALPSVQAWARRLGEIPPTDDRHIETLREWCARVLQDPDAWGAHNPLIEVVCD